MSTDDGVLVRFHEGKYVVQTYFASEDSYPPIEMAPSSQRYYTLDEAIMSNLTRIAESEYGVSFQVGPPATPATCSVCGVETYDPTVIETTLLGFLWLCSDHR